MMHTVVGCASARWAALVVALWLGLCARLSLQQCSLNPTFDDPGMLCTGLNNAPCYNQGCSWRCGYTSGTKECCRTIAVEGGFSCTACPSCVVNSQVCQSIAAYCVALEEDECLDDPEACVWGDEGGNFTATPPPTQLSPPPLLSPPPEDDEEDDLAPPPEDVVEDDLAPPPEDVVEDEVAPPPEDVVDVLAPPATTDQDTPPLAQESPPPFSFQIPVINNGSDETTQVTNAAAPTAIHFWLMLATAFSTLLLAGTGTR